VPFPNVKLTLLKPTDSEPDSPEGERRCKGSGVGPKTLLEPSSVRTAESTSAATAPSQRGDCSMVTSAASGVIGSVVGDASVVLEAEAPTSPLPLLRSSSKRRRPRGA
jgi:hypothetical protein